MAKKVKVLAATAGQLEAEFLNTYGRRREPIPRSCSLNSTYMLWHTPPRKTKHDQEEQLWS